MGWCGSATSRYIPTRLLETPGADPGHRDDKQVFIKGDTNITYGQFIEVDRPAPRRQHHQHRSGGRGDLRRPFLSRRPETPLMSNHVDQVLDHRKRRLSGAQRRKYFGFSVAGHVGLTVFFLALPALLAEPPETFDSIAVTVVPPKALGDPDPVPPSPPPKTSPNQWPSSRRRLPRRPSRSRRRRPPDPAAAARATTAGQEAGAEEARAGQPAGTAAAEPAHPQPARRLGLRRSARRLHQRRHHRRRRPELHLRLLPRPGGATDQRELAGARGSATTPATPSSTSRSNGTVR